MGRLLIVDILSSIWKAEHWYARRGAPVLILLCAYRWVLVYHGPLVGDPVERRPDNGEEVFATPDG